MNNTLEKLVTLIAAAWTACGCCNDFKPGTAKTFPVIKQEGKVAIVAHRGFWNCEAAGYSQNSIAALKAAQDNGFWGSECDLQMTSDDIVIVNHDDQIDGVRIWDNPYSAFASMTLNNGEHPSTLDQYLDQTAKCKTTMLVIELKKQKDLDREDILWKKTVQALKAHKLYNPRRVIFISFSKHLSQLIAAEAPQFVNQYLNGDFSPEEVAGARINGIDYNQKVLGTFPEYVTESHRLGMTVNVWTVDKDILMQSFLQMGVDQITTNEPLVLRSILGDKEFSLTK